MIDPQFLKEYLIPAALFPLELYSSSASILLCGTAAVESDCGKFITQKEGEALGPYQIERETYSDIWNNYLKYRPNLESDIKNCAGGFGIPKYEQLCYNIILSTQMARIIYYRVKEPLPVEDDLEGMANYWKKNYNTFKGKGKIDDFIEKYNSYFS